MADKKGVEQFYSRPPVLGKWEGFKQFLWNSETSQFLGRTGSSWAKILFFYLCFYAVLVGFFAALLAVFNTTLDENKPKWQLNDGLIGSNPGLGFRPMPPESNVESTLIWYKVGEDNYKHWTDELDKFIETYVNATSDPHGIPCSDTRKPDKEKKEFCIVPIDKFSQCHPRNSFGFKDRTPCIFLKLNKIFNWEPELYKSADEKLPDNMPEDLKKHIRSIERKKNNSHSDSSDESLNMVWVTCEGENPADNEHIGAITYYPHRGFPAYYFPFQNTQGYLPPLVAVYFEKPTLGVIINIECKAWARNIKHDRADRRGSVHFELMIDSN